MRGEFYGILFFPPSDILLELPVPFQNFQVSSCSKFSEIKLQTKGNTDIGIALVRLELHGFYRSIS